MSFKPPFLLIWCTRAIKTLSTIIYLPIQKKNKKTSKRLKFDEKCDVSNMEDIFPTFTLALQYIVYNNTWCTTFVPSSMSFGHVL